MSSPRDASPCEAVIVHVDSANPKATNASNVLDGSDAPMLEAGSGENGTQRKASGGLRHGTLRRGGRWPGGPLRLPQRNQAEFVQEFNQLYRTLGMRLEVFEVDADVEVEEEAPPAETP